MFTNILRAPCNSPSALPSALLLALSCLMLGLASQSWSYICNCLSNSPLRPLLTPSYHVSLDYTILLLSFSLLLRPPRLRIHECNSLCMLALVDEPENVLRASFRPCRDEGMLAATLGKARQTPLGSLILQVDSTQELGNFAVRFGLAHKDLPPIFRLRCTSSP